NPITTVGTLHIQPGGVLRGGNGTLSVNGDAGAWINNGTFQPGTSTIAFTNANATIAGTSDFYNITVAQNASLRPLTASSMRIFGTLDPIGTILFGVIDNRVEYAGTNQ